MIKGLLEMVFERDLIGIRHESQGAVVVSQMNANAGFGEDDDHNIVPLQPRGRMLSPSLRMGLLLSLNISRYSYYFEVHSVRLRFFQ